MGAPTYYRASQRISPQLWLALLVGVGGAGVLGLGFGYAATWITELFDAGALLILVTPFFGAALAFVTLQVVNRGKLRQPRLRLPLALVIGAVGLVATWYAQEGLGWFGRIVEAAIVLGMVAYLIRIDVEVPFCESCGAWTSEQFSLELADAALPDVAAKLAAGDVAALAGVAAPASDAIHYGVARVYACPCGQSRYLSLDRATIRPGRSRGFRYRPLSIGGRPRMHYDLGRGASTDLTPMVTNLAIDPAADAALRDARAPRQ